VSDNSTLPYPVCSYCGGRHNYSAVMCKDFMLSAGLYRELATARRDNERLRSENLDLSQRLEQMRGGLRETIRQEIEPWLADNHDKFGWGDYPLMAEEIDQHLDAIMAKVSALSAPPGELAREVREGMVEMRDACAAAMRVLARWNLSGEFGDELANTNVKDGFGVRCDALLAKMGGEG